MVIFSCFKNISSFIFLILEKTAPIGLILSPKTLYDKINYLKTKKSPTRRHYLNPKDISREIKIKTNPSARMR